MYMCDYSLYVYEFKICVCIHVCMFSFFFSALSLVTEGRKLVFAPCHY